MADKDKDESPAASETTTDDVTPKEVATQSSVRKMSRDERAAAMARENAATMAPSVDPKDRDKRIAQMARENAVSSVPAEDDERKARSERAAQMARENAAAGS